MVFNLSQAQRKLFSLLEKLNIEAYAVGGFVRDSVMGRPAHDLDIAVSTSPDQTKALISPYASVIETGVRFGTVTVLLEGESFELTTFRDDVGIGDGRHPADVVFVSSLERDLARRDFTVNAMAWSPKTGLIDRFGGTLDVENKVIRCVGDPEKRFEEDGLRILRAIRFACALGFDVEENTSRALFSCSGYLKNVSSERIFAELEKTLLSEKPQKNLEKYEDVYKCVLPLICVKNADLDSLPRNLDVRLAAIFKTPENARLATDFLKTPKELRNSVADICSLLPLEDNEEKIRLVGIKYKTHAIKYAAAISGCNTDIEKIEFVRPDNLGIDGTRLMELGVKKGADVGDAINRLCIAVIRGECENNLKSLENYTVRNILA